MTTNDDAPRGAEARDHERAALLEQRQELRRIAVGHYARARDELNRLNEDLVRTEVLFAERTEGLDASPSFTGTLTRIAQAWREAAALSRANREGDERLEANEDIAIATTLNTCAEQIEALLNAGPQS